MIDSETFLVITLKIKGFPIGLGLIGQLAKPRLSKSQQVINIMPDDSSDILIKFPIARKDSLSFFEACFLILYFHACACIYGTYMNKLVFKPKFLLS